MQGQQSATRFHYLDNASGILITFIVLLYHLPIHCGLGGFFPFINIRTVLDFFMAWFFFKSGMLHKERPIKLEFQKCWRRLILPYLVINICCLAAHVAFFKGDISVSEIIKVAIYNECEDLCYPLWFCLSLAIVRLLYQLMTNRGTACKWIVAIIALLFAFLMHLYSYKLGDETTFKSILPVTIPYWFGNVFLGLFFYSLGDLLREKQFNRYLFISALFIYVVHLFFPVYLDLWYNHSDSYFLSVLYYISGIVVFNNVLSRWLNQKVPLLSHIGENSMVYYITHGTFFELLLVLHTFIFTGWHLYIGMFLLSVLFLACMDYLFRKTKLRALIGG